MRAGFWHKCRTGLRWCRISILLLVLIILCCLIWFNRVGLPDFLKRSLIQDLRERGIVVEFSRLRLHWVRGLVAEDVRVGDTNMFDQPSLSLNQLQLRLDYHALLRRQLEIKEVVLRQGKLVWPVTATNTLTLDNIQSELRFGENDVWSLDRFQADFAGAAFALSGDIVHGSEIRNWDILRGGKSAGVTNWRERLSVLYDVLQEIHFPHAPQLSLVVNGDARNFHSFIVWLNIMAPAVQTPWFDSQDFQFTSTLTAPASAPTNFDSAWGFWTNAQPFRLSWNARFAELRTKGLDVNSFVCGGFWQAPELTVTNLSAELGGGRDEARARLNVATRQLTFTNSACFDFHAIAGLLTEKAQAAVRKATWRQSPLLQVGGSLILPAWTDQRPDWQGEVPPKLQLNGSLAVTNFAFEKLALDLARADFSYSNRVWQLSDFWLAQAKTVLWLDGGVDERAKNYNCRVRGAFDPAAIRPFLTASNEVHGLNQFKITEPIALDVTVNGQWPDFDSIDASGRVALTNFAVRGQSIDNVAGTLHYTNRVLKFFHPQLWRENGTQTMKADEITLDFRKLEIFFTNGFSTADPEAVARAIGPKTGELMEPYRFLQPPSVRVNGCSPMRNVQKLEDVADADLTFDVLNPAPFQWLKLKTPGIAGTIHWLGAQLILTNVTGSFYGGKGNGFADFDFTAPHSGVDYQFSVEVTNVNLHSLSVDLSSATNHLEGTFAGLLAVTNANSEDWRSWNGYGHVNLRDGLLWDIRLFSIMSPVMNTIIPGVGNSRATDASAKFSITNGMISTDSLEIRTKQMRLEYVGDVSLKQDVDARVTAQLLRDAPMIGPLISKALWPVSKLFEYKVTGTLTDPKLEPVYVPTRILLLPLQIFRSVGDLLPGDSSNSTAP